MWVPAARTAAGRRLALAPSPLLPWRAGGPTLQRWSSSATPPQEADSPAQRTLADADGPKGAKRAGTSSVMEWGGAHNGRDPCREDRPKGRIEHVSCISAERLEHAEGLDEHGHGGVVGQVAQGVEPPAHLEVR